MGLQSRFRPSVFFSLFRALFPQWGFFDQVGHDYELDFRTSEEDPWMRIVFEEPRRVLGLLFNPRVHFALMKISLIEQFAVDLSQCPQEEPEAITQLTTYRLLRNLIQVKLDELGLKSETAQFKIVAKDEAGENELFVSSWFQERVPQFTEDSFS